MKKRIECDLKRDKSPLLLGFNTLPPPKTDIHEEDKFED